MFVRKILPLVLVKVAGLLVGAAAVGCDRDSGASVGVEWHGSVNGVTDFSFVEPADGEDIVRMPVSWWGRAAEDSATTGEAQIFVAGRKVKLRWLDSDGQLVRVLEGVFSSDNRFVGGLAYGPNGSPMDGGTPWWATVELDVPGAPSRIDLNTTSIGVLRTILTQPRDAWPIVERRYVVGRYESYAELQELGISSSSISQVNEVANAP